jgi:hypothetical protein
MLEATSIRADRPGHSFSPVALVGVSCRRRRASVEHFGHIVNIAMSRRGPNLNVERANAFGSGFEVAKMRLRPRQSERACVRWRKMRKRRN